jgi:hypothetical protein
MGGMITRLKMVSITSCVISLVGLPMFIAIKNGDFPTAKQAALGGVAFMGAGGSTLALHFVFGPYITHIEKVPVRVCHYNKNKDKEDETHDDSDVTIERDDTPKPKDFMLKATTRSVFGWRSELVFDPAIDVTPYEGIRPFANFAAKNVTLYAHPELLDDETRQQLLWSRPQEEETTPTKEHDDDLL